MCTSEGSLFEFLPRLQSWMDFPLNLMRASGKELALQLGLLRTLVHQVSLCDCCIFVKVQLAFLNSLLYKIISLPTTLASMKPLWISSLLGRICHFLKLSSPKFGFLKTDFCSLSCLFSLLGPFYCLFFFFFLSPL